VIVGVGKRPDYGLTTVRRRRGAPAKYSVQGRRRCPKTSENGWQPRRSGGVLWLLTQCHVLAPRPEPARSLDGPPCPPGWNPAAWLADPGPDYLGVQPGPGCAKPLLGCSMRWRGSDGVGSGPASGLRGSRARAPRHPGEPASPFAPGGLPPVFSHREGDVRCPHHSSSGGLWPEGPCMPTRRTSRPRLRAPRVLAMRPGVRQSASEAVQQLDTAFPRVPLRRNEAAWRWTWARLMRAPC